jgi:hypothetical protein
MTKLTAFSLATMLTITAAYSLEKSANDRQANLLNSCMVVESNLPISHHNHPCHATYMSNKSWWAWLSSDSKSAHFHFLDLVELLHYSFLK